MKTKPFKQFASSEPDELKKDLYYDLLYKYSLMKVMYESKRIDCRQLKLKVIGYEAVGRNSTIDLYNCALNDVINRIEHIISNSFDNNVSTAKIIAEIQNMKIK